jgi:hypothetical protein
VYWYHQAKIYMVQLPSSDEEEVVPVHVPEPEEKVLQRVLARSVCMAVPEEQHRQQVEAYNTDHLEVYIFASE